MIPKLPRSGWILSVAAALAPAALAQTPQDQETQTTDLMPELRAWQARHGERWQVRTSRETGYARLLYGSRAGTGQVLRTETEYLNRTRSFVEEAEGLLGVAAADLRDERVTYLPLGTLGSTDKVAVEFTQSLDGVPVRGAGVNAIYLASGELVALDSQALPQAPDFDGTPERTADEAVRFAIRTFRSETGVSPTEIRETKLWVEREKVGKTVRPTLAWQVELYFRGPNADVEGYRYLVSATGKARVVTREDLIHFWDVGGTVTSNATPGTLPDEPSNPPVQTAMQYMTVTSSAGTTTTDENGFFNFPGVSGPLDVTFTYTGTYNDVYHATSSEYSLTVPLATGTSNSVAMNAAPTEAVTAQSNVFHQINVMRDWTRAVNPADSTMDAVNTANVMLDFFDAGPFIITNCNAFYSGADTNYFWEDGGCVNTAYSTIIHHEQGHWQNDRYGSFNGSDGFGEGNADVFAMYINDNPILGENFSTSGFTRTGLNTLQYCGDGNGGCYGAVHTDGQVLMGAMWKMRANLNVTHGNATGDAIADLLFSSWMNGYDQQTIDSIIEIQLLTLDDDDGDLDNGTPNFDDINDAFLEQGFPGFQIPYIDFSNEIEPSDTFDQAGPYGVALDLAANLEASIASATLHYRVNGGGFAAVPMTVATGNTWKALIPGIPSPSRVEYYVEATDSGANTQTLPAEAPTSLKEFFVGDAVVFFEDDFETAGDNGWTHALVSNQDDWQHDSPTGKSGTSQGVFWSDPAAAASGTQVWGNDLGPAGFNGSYQANTENYLLSPPVDLSSAAGTRLRFKRWLTVEEGIFDQAEVNVDGTTVWSNPANGNLVDSAWTDVEIDISAEADGDPSAQIEWRLRSDGGLQLGGWNIDDVEVLSLLPSPTENQPSNYGAGLAGTNGVPSIDTAGQPTTLGNNDHVVAVKNGLPGATCYLIYGSSSLDIFIGVLQGNLLVSPEDGYVLNTDLFGQAHFPVPVPGDPGFLGQSFFFQGLVVDPVAPGPFALTDGLQVTIGN